MVDGGTVVTDGKEVGLHVETPGKPRNTDDVEHSFLLREGITRYTVTPKYNHQFISSPWTKTSLFRTVPTKTKKKKKIS